MILHLIRHGHTQGTQEKRYYGQTDLAVTQEGLEELAQKRDKGGYPPLEGLEVFVTPLQRTHQTLQALYDQVEHQVLEGFAEVNFGIFEMTCYEEVKEDPQYQEWVSGDYLSNVPPGGESFHQFRQRVVAEFHRLVKEGRNALVVAHSGTIAVVMDHLFPGEQAHFYAWAPEPGEGYTLELEDVPEQPPEGPSQEGPVKILDYSLLPRPSWQGQAWAFFQNTNCQYFPCHKTPREETFNCLFCYCPLFALGEDCGGNFTYTEKGDKNCTHCLFPHHAQNYGKVLAKYPEIRKLARKK